MLTDERDVRPDEHEPPAWATEEEAPAPDPAGTPPVVRGVVLRLVTAGAVAAALLLLGHRLGALILLAVLATSSILSLTVPGFGSAIDRFIARFQVLVGRGLAAALLGLFHLVVFVPVSLVLRLVRHDPLDLGASADDPTFWRPAARRTGTPLHSRPFTYERHPDARRRSGSVRAAVGLVAIVALLDVGVGTQLNRGPVEAAAADEFVVVVPDGAAGADEPWRQELFDEIAASYQGISYHPYRGWTAPDVTGEHLNVTDGVRRSYEADPAGGGDPIEVAFYGGSAMMGWFQRDEHTIASEVVKLAEADGIHIRAANHGQPGYSIWQELLLLQEAVARGDAPDVAVFYDGANEVVAQFRAEEPTDEPTHLQARLTEAQLDAPARTDGRPAWRRMLDDWSSTSAVAELWRRARGVDDRQAATQLEILWPNPSEDGAARGAAAARLHGQAVDLIETVSQDNGVQASFFWQPWIYSKDVQPGEEGAVGSWGTDVATWSVADSAALDNLHGSVVDLSDALDQTEEPVMYDFVHTNEAGAEIVADALYSQLRPQLVTLQAQGGTVDDPGEATP